MWFGVMMTVNLAIGTVTPPVALNLYVAANLAGIFMGKKIFLRQVNTCGKRKGYFRLP
jgi:TRAP-type C4-dicarboxylate transport system permease large subunit